MKHLTKIFITFLLMMSVRVYAVYGKDLTDYCKGEGKTKETCVNTVTYCYEDGTKFTGCAFDQDSPVYSISGGAGNDYHFTGAMNTPFNVIVVDKDIPLTRSYVAVDNDNTVQFMGCYKGYIERKFSSVKDEYGNEIDSSSNWLVKSCTGEHGKCLGAAYFFKLIIPNNNTCEVSRSTKTALFLATDLNKESGYTDSLYNKDFDSRTFNNRNYNMSIQGYEPTNASGCPTYLNFNPSISATMDSRNRYVLSNTQKIEYSNPSMYMVVSDFFNKQYNQNHVVTGCTTEDVEGVEEMRQCFENKAEEIKKFNCPNDKSGYDKLKENFDVYQKECKSKYDELYSRNLITESSEKYLKIINDAVIQVIDECYESKCGVDPAKVKEYLKGTKCENGCVESIKDQSDSPSASCWMCTGGSDPFYKWMESSDVSKYSTCHPESSISKDDCYGKVSEKSCYTCLKEAYSKAGLTETQITCIEEGEAVKQKIIKGIEDSSSEHDENQIDQNAQNTNYFFHIPGLEGFGFGNAKKCSEIFGENLGVKIIKGIINALRIVGAIIAIANAMITLIPAVISKDADGLKKAGRKLVTMAVVLAIIGILPSIVNLIGLMFGYDLTCIF